MVRRSIAIALTVLTVAAGTAHGAVYWRGHRVSVALVGGIDASPCADPGGCVRGVVALKYRHRSHDHLIRCGHPRHLHVMGTFRENGHRHVAVWACSRAYDWRLRR